MLENIEVGNAADAFQNAHALKGISGNMSMTTLYNALLPLVEEFRAGKMDNISTLLPPVQVAYQQVEEAIHNLD